MDGDKPHSIHNSDHHHLALLEMQRLIEADSPEEQERLRRISSSLRSYEEEHFPAPDTNPIDVIRYRMTEMDLSADQIDEKVGFKLSDVFNNPEALEDLSLRQIKTVSKELNIPATIFIPK